ncbi:hypothetical protein CRYUN_Cryun07bG0180800 [Craigia yunnanensis]
MSTASMVDPHDKMKARDVNKVAKGQQAPRPVHEYALFHLLLSLNPPLLHLLVLCRRVVYPTLRYTATGGKIISEKGVGTLLSVTASLKQCIKQFRKLNFLKGDREPDPQPCFRMFHDTC